MFKKVLFLILILAIPFCLSAQSAGKMIGVVTDSETGEPLPGVNVVLQGTFLGATTDVDGYYIILSVPVGVYTIEASYIGYTKLILQNVRVSADVTTQKDFKLSPTTLELGEEVIVVADRPLVEKHVTHSGTTVNSEDLANLPIRGTQNILNFVPSVVVQDGSINIRGGRGEEVGYYLDGASTLNPVNRTNAVHVIHEAVEETQVLTGGFGAEYGDANSGIVKTQLKQGTPEWHASLMMETDKFASEGEKFLGTYSYQDHVIVGTVSGPITKNIRFFLAGENESIGDSRKRFSTGYDFTRIDVNPSQPSVRADSPDTVNIKYPDGFTPNNWSDRYVINSTLTFDFNPFIFRLSAIYNNLTSVATFDPMRTNLETRWVEDKLNYLLVSGKFTHAINSKTMYDVNISVFHRTTDEEDPYFGNNWQKWADSAAVAQASNGAIRYRDAWQADYDYWFNGIPFTRPGGDETYQKSKMQYLSGGVDFISQINKNHELKFGLSARQYEIRSFSIDPYIMSITDDSYRDDAGKPKAGFYFKGGLGGIPYDVYRLYMANTYGYDQFGNEAEPGGFESPRYPLIGAAYFTDKIEYEDLVINAGLRLDYLDADDYTLKNPGNPKADAGTQIIPKSEWENVDPHIHLSPRLGISFPVSETTKFYTQYGKYVQLPEFDDFYYNTYQYSRQMQQGGYFWTNPIGYGFDPIFTTSYEVGFQKQLGDYAAINIAGFYKNVKGQILTTKVVPEAGSSLKPHNILVNGDFSTNRGLEFSINLRRFNRIQAQLNYTLTAAEGTGSGETAYISAADRVSQYPTVLAPLNFSQTHRGAILLDYRFGKGDGGPVFEEFGVNLMFRFNSGHPFTFVTDAGGQSGAYTGGTNYMNDTRSRKAEEPINASVTPWTQNLDLRIDKSFDVMDKLSATVYVRIYNLFNTKNTINVYQQTGSDTDDGYITNWTKVEPNYNLYGGEEYLQLYNALNTANASAYLSQLGLELWDHPRQILFGIKLNY
ncbi:MAG: TonB-dependent receptor [Calditrichaceae bacterium]|nr:TonB-dependent receptor [Calditrichaceae bacterium]MBN2709168.1 TonB-dependent receptor [Calditrichaceae bacterium]RQV96124.1 MAG: TonB-dependent receptor [Calditrichota bacterium]